MSNEKYNGWSSYETWLVYCHLTSNQDLYSEFHECKSTVEIEMLVDLCLDIDELEEKGEKPLLVDVLRAFKSEIDFEELFESIQTDEIMEEKTDD